MNYYLFRVLDGVSIEVIQNDLEKKGLKDTFIIEDDAVGAIFIGGHSKKTIATKNGILVEQKAAVVDWKEQWGLFAENFTKGKAHIQLGETTLLLTPGSGFGDLSHPTTYLMLELMKGQVDGESVIDIGTGSGILALAALQLGARSAIGIDIDRAAIQHAKENAKINGLKALFTKQLPKNLPKENIFLMNMIVPEQIEFAPQRFNPQSKLWIVSGILETERERYFHLTKEWKWRLILEKQKSEWIGCIFTV